MKYNLHHPRCSKGKQRIGTTAFTQCGIQPIFEKPVSGRMIPRFTGSGLGQLDAGTKEKLLHRVPSTQRDVIAETVQAVDDEYCMDDDEQAIAKGGVACPFPWKLHKMLDAVEEEGLEHVVSWRPHGRAFTVHKPKEFVQLFMPRFFGQTKFASFQRQLNLYEFQRFAHGVDKGAYYNFCFIRGHRAAVRNMVRRKIKGTKIRRTLDASEEPNFYSEDWQVHATNSNGSFSIQRAGLGSFAGTMNFSHATRKPRDIQPFSSVSSSSEEKELSNSSNDVLSGWLASTVMSSHFSLNQTKPGAGDEEDIISQDKLDEILSDGDLDNYAHNPLQLFEVAAQSLDQQPLMDAPTPFNI